ncbi:hypothetical protein G3A_14425 [Bacillus sp. 17376]|uniref:hypothetical protein n=1 Tax=Mesobacillus boroniphilus TaxID=308892 RepID=UPI0003C7DB48|nr:hypothetical protein [Mesobacillus boroniphilus]ESU31866.1 hypothetical protein G3A_14425 [Bacillus sp. 17376]
MKLWKELNYKEKAARSFYATCCFALLILIPNYPIGIYFGVMAFNGSGTVYYLIKHHRSNASD